MRSRVGSIRPSPHREVISASIARIRAIQSCSTPLATTRQSTDPPPAP